MVSESETNFGGTGNVASFSFHMNLGRSNLKNLVVDAEENPIVAKKNCGHMEISQKELTVVCQGEGWIDYYTKLPFQLGPLHTHGTGAVAIFMIVPVCTFLLLFALPLRVLLF